LAGLTPGPLSVALADERPQERGERLTATTDGGPTFVRPLREKANGDDNG
jgi:hypothetical protein